MLPSTFRKALLIFALAFTSGANGSNSMVSTQCRQLQTDTYRLALLGDCINNAGVWSLTYIYLYNCLTADIGVPTKIVKGPSSKADFEKYCDQCLIAVQGVKAGIACHCGQPGGYYLWTDNPLDIDSIFELDGIGNMICA